MKPKYSIVRIDNNMFCPSHFEKINNDFVCEYDKKNKSCDNCRYGDTKEQLERKVEQIIKRVEQEKKDGKIINITPLGLAMTIIEGLGVTK